MKAILAVNNLGYIGLNGGLPWKSSDDFAHFKKLTNNVIMLAGYNTFSTLPIFVKKRTIVLNDVDFNINEHNIENIWCIGGKKTYEKYCHLFTELHISHINDNTLGDTLFPCFNNLNKDCKIFNYNFEIDKIK